MLVLLTVVCTAYHHRGSPQLLKRHAPIPLANLFKPLLRHTQQCNTASQAVECKKLSTLFPTWREMAPALAHRVLFRGLKNVFTCQKHI